MKWQTAAEDSIRTHSWFALIPVRIGEQIRWLERVTVRQCYNVHQGWVNIRFL